MLLKVLNGKIAFLSFEPGELECPVKSFAPVVIGLLVGALMEWVGRGGNVLGSEAFDGVEEGRSLVAIEES